MTAEPKIIDINDDPSLRAIVEEMEASGHDVILRRDNEVVARLTPIRHKRRKLSDEDLEAFRSSAGGWKGLIDEDKFLADNYASRDTSFPRPVG